MLSKLVVDHGKTAGALIAALREHAGVIGAGGGGRLGSMTAPHEQVPDLGFLAELVARRLEHDRAELERADLANNAELADDAAPRAARDEAAADVRATLLEVKQAVSTLFGDAWTLHLEVPTIAPQDPLALARAAKQVASALKDKKLPKPKFEGVKSVNPAPLAKRLRRAAKALEAAQAVVAQEADEASATLAAKHRAMAEFEASFAAASSIARALLRLAGKPDEADRIPMSLRRKRAPETAEPELQGP